MISLVAAPVQQRLKDLEVVAAQLDAQQATEASTWRTLELVHAGRTQRRRHLTGTVADAAPAVWIRSVN